LAAAGFVLGAYGAATVSAQGTETTATEPTTVETTADTTTLETTEPTTTNEPVTTTETQTTTVPATVPTATTGAESSSSSTPWGWIALGLAVAALLLIGFLLWQRRRSGTAYWRTKAANLHRRCLVALDDVLAKGSVVTGQIEALAMEARSLEPNAPDAAAKASIGEVRARLEDLVQALDSDRTLRLGSPPPSADQLSFSTAVIRQQVEQLQASLRQPGTRPSS
jgi:hypothetical protein